MIHEDSLPQWIEALLLAAGRPLTEEDMLSLFSDSERPSKPAFKKAIRALQESLEHRGIGLIEVASGYRFQVKKEFAPWIAKLWEEKPPKYSRALLETLALIAYKQPITRGEIEDIRGVSVSPSILQTLVVEREWARVVGHKEVPGRPALYATTKTFLDEFGLKSLNDLPTLPQIMDLDAVPAEAAEVVQLELELNKAEHMAPNEAMSVEGNESEASSSQTAAETEFNEDASETEEIEVTTH